MKTVFNKTIINGQQLERPCKAYIGGRDYCVFNPSDWDSIQRAMYYVGSTCYEQRMIKAEFDKNGSL